MAVTGLAICPQVSLAEGFTGKDFSAWPVESQDSFIQTSVTMAGVVLTQLQPEKSTCIDKWYIGEGRRAERDAYIRETIIAYSNFHPSGTLLAILVEACGSLK
ncbi:MAG: hypothetical protein KDA50_06430 [Rhodobacteraceae bacterium]|nr:hypothetical protein [Paracoccaceae bacterium]